MRDAFGGTFMIEILMVFIVLFVSFTAVIVNVAKTFRIKNEVINIVERTQYSGGISSEVEDYISRAGYQNVKDNDLKTSCEKNGDSSHRGVWGSGYCIAPVVSETTNSVVNYKVTVYVSVSLPFFDIDLTLPVSGETKSYYDLT